MSWRLILVIVLLAFGASIWGGYTLGDWLIENGPLRSPTMVALEEEANALPTLDANGRPYVAPAAQPLINGRFGVPNNDDLVDWKISTKSADHYNPPIALSRQRFNDAQAAALREGTGGATSPSGLQGLASVSRSRDNNRANTAANQALQPVEIDVPPPPTQGATQATHSDPNWEAKLQRELHACSQRGFFERPSCAWEARNKYCEPNNAWGRSANCPSKAF